MYCGGESGQGHVTPLTNQIAHLSIVRVKTRLKWHPTNQVIDCMITMESNSLVYVYIIFMKACLLLCSNHKINLEWLFSRH